MPYLITFSRKSLEPPSRRRRKPQFTNPPKSLKPDDQEKRESHGRWTGLSGRFLRILCSSSWASSTEVVDLIRRSLVFPFPFEMLLFFVSSMRYTAYLYYRRHTRVLSVCSLDGMVVIKWIYCFISSLVSPVLLFYRLCWALKAVRFLRKWLVSFRLRLSKSANSKNSTYARCTGLYGSQSTGQVCKQMNTLQRSHMNDGNAKLFHQFVVRTQSSTDSNLTLCNNPLT